MNFARTDLVTARSHDGIKLYFNSEVDLVIALYRYLRPDTDQEWEGLNSLYIEAGKIATSHAFQAQAEGRLK